MAIELKKRAITSALLTLLVVGTFFWLPWYAFSTLLCIVAGLIIREWPTFTRQLPQLWLLFPLYPLAPLILLIALSAQPLYRPLFVYLFALVACHDTVAYLVGARWGTTRFAPTISPGKSFEGCLGGFAGCLAATWLVAQIFGYHVSHRTIFWLSLAVSILAVTGDLFESWLKRRAGIKDSGSCLPGHGGLLDRCDALLFVGVLFYCMREALSVVLLHR
jgi:phosphatidate cytidylyltransferase